MIKGWESAPGIIRACQPNNYAKIRDTWLTQQGSLTLQSTPLVELLNIEADATERYSGRAAMLSPAVIDASVNSMRFALPAPFAAILAAGKTSTSSRHPTAGSTPGTKPTN